MMQIARNLTDAEDGFLWGKRYVLMDRDGKFSPAFQGILRSVDVNPVPLPARSPNLNAHLERFHKSLKRECLDRMIFFGERMLRNAVGQFLEYYHHERNHQGLDNCIIQPGEEVGRNQGVIACRERLGGLLRYYHRKARVKTALNAFCRALRRSPSAHARKRALPLPAQPAPEPLRNPVRLRFRRCGVPNSDCQRACLFVSVF